MSYYGRADVMRWVWWVPIGRPAVPFSAVAAAPAKAALWDKEKFSH